MESRCLGNPRRTIWIGNKTPSGFDFLRDGLCFDRHELVQRPYNFALVDAAMNDMIRPALYQAWLEVKPLRQDTDAELATWDVVGPVCETADFLARDRALALAPGDLLALCGAGAYGFVMSSNYNSRGRAPEIMVDGADAHLVRERESIADIIRGESRLPDAASARE
mgnify:CR=1 FL=1